VKDQILSKKPLPKLVHSYHVLKRILVLLFVHQFFQLSWICIAHLAFCKPVCVKNRGQKSWCDLKDCPSFPNLNSFRWAQLNFVQFGFPQGFYTSFLKKADVLFPQGFLFKRINKKAGVQKRPIQKLS